MSLQFLQLDVELSTGSKLVPRTLGSPMVPGPMAGPGLGSILAGMASQRKGKVGNKSCFLQAVPHSPVQWKGFTPLNRPMS